MPLLDAAIQCDKERDPEQHQQESIDPFPAVKNVISKKEQQKALGSTPESIIPAGKRVGKRIEKFNTDVQVQYDGPDHHRRPEQMIRSLPQGFPPEQKSEHAADDQHVIPYPDL